MPMYFLPGNHDPRDVFFRNMFPSSVGTSLRSAMNVSFTHKGIQFICIDWGSENKGVSTPAMIDHLRRSLDDNRPTIILSHHHVTPIGVHRFDQNLADDMHLFESVIRGRNVLAILAGHAHTTYETELAAIPVYGLRSTHYSFAQSGEEWCYVLRPPHYRVVTVDGDKLTSEIVEVAI